MTMEAVLSGIRILDFGRYIAGPYASCLLGDLGAEVIRVERVGGGEDRFVFPLAGDEGGANYLQFNRNKASIALDIASEEGRDIVQDLIKTADVVIVNLPPDALNALGLDYSTLKKIKPSIILTTITAFGSQGPLADLVGFDGIAQVMSGNAWMSGHGGAPIKAYVPWVDCLTASFAASGTLAALMWMRQTGEGQHVEADLLKSSLVPASALLAEEAVLDKGRKPTGNRSQTGGPADLVKTSDGFVYIHVVGNSLFRRFCRMIGDERLQEDPRFADDVSRSEHGEEMSAVLAAWCREKMTENVLAACKAARIPAGPVLTPRSVLELEHLEATSAFNYLSYPGMPKAAPILTTPFSLSRTPPAVRGPAPTIGADTEELLRQLGRSSDEIAMLRKKSVI